MTARDAWGQVAHNLRVLADSIDSAIEPDARASVPPSVPTGAAVAEAGDSPPASAPLGACPVHHVAWVVKDGGISKNGKPYPAFWKCKERDEQGYCNEKPSKAWADSHPIQVHAVEDVPF